MPVSMLDEKNGSVSMVGFPLTILALCGQRGESVSMLESMLL